jgi:Na+/H+-translocating membrane pyrophosphatase
MDAGAVDIATPEVLVGGLLGVMMVFYFVGLSVAAVGRTAGHVVEEVRRQLRENPLIMQGKVSHHLAMLLSFRACRP